MDDPINLKDFVGNCENVRDVFRKVREESLILQVVRLEGHYEKMIPLAEREDFAIVQATLQPFVPSTYSDPFIHPYGSQIGYRVAKQ